MHDNTSGKQKQVFKRRTSKILGLEGEIYWTRCPKTGGDVAIDCRCI
jgi:hypothetical protein